MLLKVAQIKVLPRRGDLAANHAILMRLLDRLAIHSPDVVVTPECFLDGYVAVDNDVTREKLLRCAIDPINSPHAKAVAEWAKANRAWVIFGCSRQIGGVLYNSALVFDRAGALAGLYDKTHIQTHDLKYSAGESLPVFTGDFGKFGVLICADRRWPESVRTLALRDAKIVFNPTYGMHDERNLCMMRTRGFESEIFIAFTHPRQALLVGPEGEVLRNECDVKTDFTVTQIDLDRVNRVRQSAAAHLRDRRSDLYAR